jgi:predicted small metal-binding protein
MRRWRCLEHGCEVEITAADDDELVAAVGAHVREAHGSYELEDVVLANAEEVDEPEAGRVGGE